MLEIAIMIEGQNGLNWPRWQQLVNLVEDLGFAGLCRSDHFTNATPPDLDSLELWVSLAWLADHTSRLEFGPLVSPVSCRNPSFTARMASAVDDLSDGRLILGLGAGWQEREHQAYGFDLLPIPERFNRFKEGLEVITRLLKSGEPVNYDGRYYKVNGATLLPRPRRPAGPPILIGGNGKTRTLPLVSKYADEWNAVYLKPQQYSLLSLHLDELLLAHGRSPHSVKRSLMTGLCFGRTSWEFDRKLSARGSSVDELRQRGVIVGVGDEIMVQLHELEQTGLQRVMLQWLDLDDLEGLSALAKVVL